MPSLELKTKFEAHYEPVKLHWEQRFEARYGFFCGFWDQAVARYLDCGIWDNGFARIRCDACRHEMLVAFSCYLELETIRSFL